MIFEYNDEADENAELAKNASIYGVAYELLYFSDEEHMIRFKALNPTEIIPIYDKTVEENLLAVIRYLSSFKYLEETYSYDDLINSFNPLESKLESIIKL